MIKKTRVLPALILLAAQVLACSTPVFRYAIERWPADSYRMLVFSEKELSADDQQLLAAAAEKSEGAFYSHTSLISEMSDEVKAVYDAVTNKPALPFFALLYPLEMGTNLVVQAAPLTSNALDRVIMSPVRLKIAQSLIGGDAAVWLLIKGPDDVQNREIRAMLDSRLREIEQTAEFNSDFVELAEMAGTGVPELKFSVLEMDRNDPQESLLMEMLTRIVDDRQDLTGPLIIPVFGQGRALVLLLKDRISEETVDRVAAFLIGNCSCEVKSMNPGFDLLIGANWVSGITNEYVFDAQLPPLSSPTASPDLLLGQADDRTNAAAFEPEPLQQVRPFCTMLSVWIGIAAAGLAATTWVLIRKNKHHESD